MNVEMEISESSITASYVIAIVITALMVIITIWGLAQKALYDSTVKELNELRTDNYIVPKYLTKNGVIQLSNGTIWKEIEIK